MKHRWWHLGVSERYESDYTLSCLCKRCGKLIDTHPPAYHCSRCGGHIPKSYAGAMCTSCWHLRISIGDDR